MKTIDIDHIKYTGLLDRVNNTRGVQPMTKRETELFLKLTMGEMSKGSGPPEPDSPEAKLLEALMQETSTQIIVKRIKGMTDLPWEEVVSFSALMFISCMEAIENPAQCVLWAYTLLYMRAGEGEVIDMNLLSQWFPAGFPTEERYREAWDKQKGHELKIVKCDNFLDHRDWWADLAAIIGKSSEKPTMGPTRPPVDTSDIVEVDSESDLEAV